MIGSSQVIRVMVWGDPIDVDGSREVLRRLSGWIA